MLKKMVWLLGVTLGGIVCVSAAQDYSSAPPKASIQQYGPFTNSNSKSGTGTTKSNGANSTSCGNPEGNCLFYGGDFLYNPLYPPFLPNGLANETDLLTTGSPYGAAVWVPFTVPAGKGWKVSALFTNNQATYGVLDQTPNTPASAAYYAVSSGVAAGTPGTMIAAGVAAATSTPTGRSAFGLNEYTIQVSGLDFELAPGNYWMVVVPICTNAGNPLCFGRFFLSDVEYLNVLPQNALGPVEPFDDSFFDASIYGSLFEPTYSPAGACFGDGCDAFSAGVIGTDIKN